MNHFEQLESYLPTDLSDPKNWPLALVVVLFAIVVRQGLLTGSIWWVFYILRPGWTLKRQIYARLPSAKDQWREVRNSVLTTVIFAVFGVALGWLWQQGWSKIYLGFGDYGYFYLAVSFFIYAVLHDLYFYLTHWLLHRPWLFRHVHFTHHQSLTPSPWDSFSFHPIEGLIQALIIPLLVLLVPIHPVVLIAYLTFMTLSAATNHLGFEVLPEGSAEHPIGQWLISGVHHSTHHRFYNQNLGLFFTWWDRILGTEKSTYAQDFAHVFTRAE